jgi:hypothetical protein
VESGEDVDVGADEDTYGIDGESKEILGFTPTCY